MKKINKTKIIYLIVALIVIALILVIIFSLNVNVKTRLFDLTENEPLKQSYARNQEHFINDIMPSSNITQEEYYEFLNNPDNYVVYTLRCQIENNSNKNLIAKYIIDEENIWIDTTTMANTNKVINKNSKINKNISLLIKTEGKNEEEIKELLNNINIKVHLYNANDSEKEIKEITAKF